jgi:hypothetical protein
MSAKNVFSYKGSFNVHVCPNSRKDRGSLDVFTKGFLFVVTKCQWKFKICWYVNVSLGDLQDIQQRAYPVWSYMNLYYVFAKTVNDKGTVNGEPYRFDILKYDLNGKGRECDMILYHIRGLSREGSHSRRSFLPILNFKKGRLPGEAFLPILTFDKTRVCDVCSQVASLVWDGCLRIVCGHLIVETFWRRRVAVKGRSFRPISGT